MAEKSSAKTPSHASTRGNGEASRAPLPPDLLDIVARQPSHVTRRAGAALISRHLFPVSHRSLEVWPLPTRRVNGRALVPTLALFEAAFARMDAAPVSMGGPRNTAGQHAA